MCVHTVNMTGRFFLAEQITETGDGGRGTGRCDYIIPEPCLPGVYILV